ncbi:MAG: sigma 54-interacting transcriptional regulator, partial [Leptolyngbyaceae cyanobacterium]
MDVAERTQWLQSHTMLKGLADETLTALAIAIQIRPVSKHSCLALEGDAPEALYVLHSGQLKGYSATPTSLGQLTRLLPGVVLHLSTILLEQDVPQTLVTFADSEIWEIPREALVAIAQSYPQLKEQASQPLITGWMPGSAALAYEQEHQQELRAFLVPRVRRGIVGTSRYAQRLRQDIKLATRDRRPVLIFGEPGLDKDNTAALIHFGSPSRREPMIQVDCDALESGGAKLFGRIGGKPGLLHWVGQGTLLLNNLQDLHPALQQPIQTLIATGQYHPLGSPHLSPETAIDSQTRLLLVSEQVLPWLSTQPDPGANLIRIKVPPLRVRKADLSAQVDYYLRLLCRAKGLRCPTITPEALRSLQSYDFPDNLKELESLIRRAVIQADEANELTPEVFWAKGSKSQRFRQNLLNAYSWLRRWFRSSWWPDWINDGLVAPLFAVVVAILFLCPQTRDSNIALNLFWAWWWPVILLVYPFLGRIWCAVCPFMIYGKITQKLSLWLWPRQLLKWPRQSAERWGRWVLFGGFALILLWEELWDLPNTAYLSAWLLLIITGGAIVCSLIFERRFWCRYLCPIGGMNGMFAKLSMTELRARQGVCSASCTTYQCYKGGPEKGEGQETTGCPLYSHPAQLQDNRDCVLCMTCLKACPHRSVEFNLRPPGIELWTTHKASMQEVSLLFLLWGAVNLHHLPETTALLVMDLHLNQFLWHGLVSIVALASPGAIALAGYGLMVALQPQQRPQPFVTLAYGFLPMVLASNLAH